VSTRDRRPTLSLLLVIALSGCGDTGPAVPPPDADVATVTDTPVTAETTEPEPDTASPDAAEDTVEEEEVVVIELPDHLGGGFVDLTEGLEGWPPFDVFAGVPEERLWPDVTHGLFVDIDGDGAMEVLLSGVAHESLVRRQLYRYVDGALTIHDDDPIDLGSVVMADDLDGDGHTDLLLVRISDYTIRWGDAAGQFAAQTTLDPTALLGEVERTAFHLLDLDDDGWLDLMVRGECGMTAMMRTGPRSFTPRPEVLAGYEVAPPYAIGHWQTPDRPRTLLVMGHAQCGFYVGLSLEGVDDDGYPVVEPVELYEGHPYPNNDLEGLISASPMGGAAGDLNRDGVMDYFMTLNPDHVIFDGTLDWPIQSPMTGTGLRVIPSDNGLA
jgi:predicted small lipoprotein YifL